MDNQHRKISGYRELNEDEIALMNRVKAFGPELEKLVDDLRKYTSVVGMIESGMSDDEVTARQINAEPGRWVAIGKTHLQEGLMALTRAVAQPDFF